VNPARIAAFALLLVAPLRGQEAPQKADSAALELFEKKIRPLLHAQCFKCHGPEKQKAGLRVDSRSALLKGGDSGPALVPGAAEKSLLLKALRQTDADLVMPPLKSGPKLPATALLEIETWINAGAPFPASGEPPPARHWAFEPLGDPAPADAGIGGARTRVDAFLLAKLGPAGARLALPADKRTLIRRATYDLTGLPPSPEEVEVFIGDASPEAFSRLIERLLDSPAYGEKWGRKWLDVARYADTAGENSDFPVPQAWRYRNYVIDAFNRDKPYDQFIREQIAGDLLAEGAAPERYAELITATGYLAIARRFGHDTDRDMHLTHEDVIDTLGKSILGLTLGCARCHNHKYDPVTARDYYSLYGILASSRFPFPGCEAKQAPRDLVPLLPAGQLESRLKPWRDEMSRLEGQLKRLEAEFAAARKGLESPAATVSIGSGELTPAGEQSFQTGRRETPKSWVTVKAGEMIQFTLLPRANHGADSTLLELEVLEQGGEGQDLEPDARCPGGLPRKRRRRAAFRQPWQQECLAALRSRARADPLQRLREGRGKDAGASGLARSGTASQRLCQRARRGSSLRDGRSAGPQFCSASGARRPGGGRLAESDRRRGDREGTGCKNRPGRRRRGVEARSTSRDRPRSRRSKSRACRDRGVEAAT
jgi:hypothetical protein